MCLCLKKLWRSESKKTMAEPSHMLKFDFVPVAQELSDAKFFWYTDWSPMLLLNRLEKASKLTTETEFTTIIGLKIFAFFTMLSTEKYTP